MCVRVATSFDARAILYGHQGELIHSVSHIKILGFHLDSDGGISGPIDKIKKRLRSGKWVLPKLKWAEFKNDELVTIFCTYLYIQVLTKLNVA